MGVREFVMVMRGARWRMRELGMLVVWTFRIAGTAAEGAKVNRHFKGDIFSFSGDGCNSFEDSPTKETVMNLYSPLLLL